MKWVLHRTAAKYKGLQTKVLCDVHPVTPTREKRIVIFKINKLAALLSTAEVYTFPMREHPCLKCGACCSHFRVSFYWREALDGGEFQGADFRVPKELAEDLTPTYSCMKGTNTKYSRKCVALEGRIGSNVKCGIYESRPSPCRGFEASYETGRKNQRCDDARAAHGLKPLTPNDWHPNLCHERPPEV